MIYVLPAVFADLARVIEIERSSVTAAHWSEDEYKKSFASATGGERQLLVLKEAEDQQVLGFIAGRKVADEWEIENVAVDGPSRRRGLGSCLLREFVGLVRSHGGFQVFLEVRESNHAARRFYEKFSFCQAGRRKAYYENPVEDAIILKLVLAQTELKQS